MYLYEYLSLCNIPYIIGNSLMSTFQYKFNCVNLSSCLWDISKQRFYSYRWPNIWLFVVAFVYPTYVQIALIPGFTVQLSLWKLVHWLWKYKLNEVCDNTNCKNYKNSKISHTIYCQSYEYYIQVSFLFFLYLFLITFFFYF